MKKVIFKNKINFKSGFTLIETLVALMIFISAVLAMITVSAGGINSTKVAQNKATATFLADEGLEFVRNIRDNYAIAGVNGGLGWYDFSTKIVDKCGTKCKIGPRFNFANLDDPAYTDSYTCSNKCETLSLYGKLAYYGYYDDANPNDNSDAVLTPFTRTINVNIVDSNNTNILKVTSKVEWEQGTQSYNVEVTEYLYNWLND